jgi:selenophosphate synthase
MVSSGAVHAATDVTASACSVTWARCSGEAMGARVEAGGARARSSVDLAQRDVVPGGRAAAVESFVDWSERMTDDQRLVLADAQTSGGLLMAAAANAASEVLASLHKHRVSASQIGVSPTTRAVSVVYTSSPR